MFVRSFKKNLKHCKVETCNAWPFVESVLTSNVLQAMKVHTDQCEAAILAEDANKMVKNTSAIARLTNRVLQLTKQEADNSGKVLPRQVCYCLLRSISISQPFPHFLTFTLWISSNLLEYILRLNRSNGLRKTCFAHSLVNLDRLSKCI